MSASQPPRPPAPAPADWQAVVRDMMRGLRYGVIQITVHDARVVQIDRTERTRLDADACKRGG